MFAYRYDSDDLCNYDRYKFSYVAQFGKGLEEGTETAAARICLPCKAGGNLRDCDSVTYFVYAEYRVEVDERIIFVDKLEAINFDDKVHVTSFTDRVIEFFGDEVLRDRHALDFYTRPALPKQVSVFDDVGPPTIDFDIKIKALVADCIIDFDETDMKKLTLAWFAPDPEYDMYFL